MNKQGKTERRGGVAVLDEAPAPARGNRRIERQVDAVACCGPDGSCDHQGLCEDCTEKELVAACRKGCRRGRRLLYETYDPRIVALMMRMTGGDPEEAFDLSQETFVRVFDKIGGFRGDSALGTWIHRVAVNQALQHLRRKKRYRRITEAFAEHTERAGTTTEDHEASMDVRDAMDQLPERMGTMVRLHYEEGMRYSQIAEELAVKPGTVASCLSRARRQLRPLLR